MKRIDIKQVILEFSKAEIIEMLNRAAPAGVPGVPDWATLRMNEQQGSMTVTWHTEQVKS